MSWDRLGWMAKELLWALLLLQFIPLIGLLAFADILTKKQPGILQVVISQPTYRDALQALVSDVRRRWWRLWRTF